MKNVFAFDIHGDSLLTITEEELEKVREQLRNTANDPNLIITTRDHLWEMFAYEEIRYSNGVPLY